MKIAVTSSGPDLDADIDPRFGRCPYIALIDNESGASETLSNPFVDASGGAGTQAAQWILDHDVHVLVTGRCGPKAMMVLDDAGIRVVEGASGKVRDAEKLIEHSVSPAAAAPIQPGRGPGMGRGRGLGGGRGFGGGHGRGGRG
ncbi:MAG: NifB/NifX family molybdenum-iron cluster-binding protein [Chromatiales bacterium]|jgi:predicted Fe-Mo cluster-binding NifX family protein